MAGREIHHLDKTTLAWHSHRVPANKLEELRELIRTFGSCLVAYSGGVDSVFLARVARDVLGQKSLAVIADSPSLPRRELREALEVAAQFEIPVRVVRTREFERPDYLANPINRCYFCKHELFTELEPLARKEGFTVIAYGENASDTGDFRPGRVAAEEFQIRAPLKEVGLTKAEIRAFSVALGLPTADKPQLACLSSRIPHGEAVTVEKLRMIEEAENHLRDLGFRDVRVRHHELESGFPQSKGGATTASSPGGTERVNPKSSRHLARIEVGSSEVSRLIHSELRLKVDDALKSLGYAHVTLDLLGYRGGGTGGGTVELSVGSGRSED